jgi:hypothetical protein
LRLIAISFVQKLISREGLHFKSMGYSLGCV